MYQSDSTDITVRWVGHPVELALSLVWESLFEMFVLEVLGQQIPFGTLVRFGRRHCYFGPPRQEWCRPTLRLAGGGCSSVGPSGGAFCGQSTANQNEWNRVACVRRPNEPTCWAWTDRFCPSQSSPNTLDFASVEELSFRRCGETVLVLDPTVDFGLR